MDSWQLTKAHRPTPGALVNLNFSDRLLALHTRVRAQAPVADEDPVRVSESRYSRGARVWHKVAVTFIRTQSSSIHRRINWAFQGIRRLITWRSEIIRN